MRIEKLASEVLQLDPNDRAHIAEAIWESLEEPFVSEAEMSDEESAQLALNRDKEIERGDVVALSHADLMSRLRGNEN